MVMTGHTICSLLPVLKCPTNYHQHKPTDEGRWCGHFYGVMSLFVAVANFSACVLHVKEWYRYGTDQFGNALDIPTVPRHSMNILN
jgi:hypothetical protein